MAKHRQRRVAAPVTAATPPSALARRVVALGKAGRRSRRKHAAAIGYVHELNKRAAQADREGDAVTAAAARAELAQIGGLAAYQAASLHSEASGSTNSSRWVVQQLRAKNLHIADGRAAFLHRCRMPSCGAECSGGPGCTLSATTSDADSADFIQRTVSGDVLAADDGGTADDPSEMDNSSDTDDSHNGEDSGSVTADTATTTMASGVVASGTSVDTSTADTTATSPQPTADSTSVPTPPLRLLDVGALGDNYARERTWVACRAIDLRAQHAAVRRSDFFAEPLERPFDVLSLCLVLNFVGEARQRGAMLWKAAAHLRPGGLLAVVIPRACVDNSRYCTDTLFRSALTHVGFSVETADHSRGLARYIARRAAGDALHGAAAGAARHGEGDASGERSGRKQAKRASGEGSTQQREKKTTTDTTASDTKTSTHTQRGLPKALQRRTVVRGGGQRNNFCVLLTPPWVPGEFAAEAAVGSQDGERDMNDQDDEDEQ